MKYIFLPFLTTASNDLAYSFMFSNINCPFLDLQTFRIFYTESIGHQIFFFFISTLKLSTMLLIQTELGLWWFILSEISRKPTSSIWWLCMKTNCLTNKELCIWNLLWRYYLRTKKLLHLIICLRLYFPSLYKRIAVSVRIDNQTKKK